MRKLLISVIVAMMAAASASAQYSAGTWSVAPWIGLGLSSVSNMNDVQMASGKLESTVAPAVGAGADFEYQVSQRVGLVAGVAYSMQGKAWKDFTQDGVKMKDPRIELDYINIPLIVNVYVSRGLALKTGLQVGFLVDSDLKMSSEGKLDEREATVDTSVDMKTDFNKVDLSIPIGLSYEFKSHFFLDARYHFGLTKVNKDPFQNGKDGRNSMAMLKFGYKFNL